VNQRFPHRLAATVLLASLLVPAEHATIAAATTGAAGASPATGTSPGASEGAGTYLLCRPLQRLTVRGRYHFFIIRNDNFAHRRECLANHSRGTNFVVIHSGADSRSPESMAYPEIMLGCAWGLCTPHSGLPVTISKLRDPESSWYTRSRAAGLWNTGYDLWFARRDVRSGQDKGAEIMIWLKTSFRPPTRRSARLVRIGGIRYWFEHWITQNRASGARWHYVLFRRFRGASFVHDLRFRPFISFTERAGLLASRWWLTSIDAGFEIWRGGTGLATRWYWARALPAR
jgi:hypothetical protein